MPNKRKRLNVSISEKAHKIIEKYQFDNNLNSKENAIEKLILEFGKIKS